jgi:hypothetical protein
MVLDYKKRKKKKRRKKRGHPIGVKVTNGTMITGSKDKVGML